MPALDLTPGLPHAGRNFPDRPGWAVVLHGKFDSEELSSDPSEHESVVDIQNELVREKECRNSSMDPCRATTCHPLHVRSTPSD